MSISLCRICSRTIFAKETYFSPILCSSRGTRYAPQYIEPVVEIEELRKPLDPNDPRRFSPVKAAVNDVTLSICYNPLVVKFIRKILRQGNKKSAMWVVKKTFAQLKFVQLEKYHKAESAEEREQIECDPAKLLQLAIQNCSPLLITQIVKRGGVQYEVPIPVTETMARHKAIKWIMESALDKQREEWLWQTLYREILDACENKGKSVRKKQELHRVCEANRAYAHYRW